MKIEPLSMCISTLLKPTIFGCGRLVAATLNAATLLRSMRVSPVDVVTVMVCLCFEFLCLFVMVGSALRGLAGHSVMVQAL